MVTVVLPRGRLYFTGIPLMEVEAVADREAFKMVHVSGSRLHALPDPSHVHLCLLVMSTGGRASHRGRCLF